MRRLLLIPLAALVLEGCNSVGCTDNQNSIPLAGFYSMATFESISLDSLAIGGVGAPGDSLLQGPFDRRSQVYLPLRSSQPETEFCISYRQKALDRPELNDTLRFTYTAIPFFASEDCGAIFHYRITRLSYTRHLIDSVGLLDSTITNVERETVRIYFRTSEPDDDTQQ